MKWAANTEYIVKKAYKRLWSMRRLKYLGAKMDDLQDVYIKQVRSILELAVPAWHAAITQKQRKDIERVQKTALHIMLGNKYSDYRNALQTVNLTALESRREDICTKFAKKAEKHPKFRNWFRTKQDKPNTRQKMDRYYPVYTNHDRFERSSISYLTKLLNRA